MVLGGINRYLVTKGEQRRYCLEITKFFHLLLCLLCIFCRNAPHPFHMFQYTGSVLGDEWGHFSWGKEGSVHGQQRFSTIQHVEWRLPGNF